MLSSDRTFFFSSFHASYVKEKIMIKLFVLFYWNALTLRRLMSYIYGAPILDVSRSHTTTQHSR